MKMNVHQKLNHAISEAHFALEEFDNFDLYSNDPKSMAKFVKLDKAHDKALAKVIKLAVKANEIIELNRE